MKSQNTRVDNTVTAVLFLQSSLPASVTDEIQDVLSKTPFDKLNVNIAVPRKLLGSSSENDTRTYMTAGNVRSYNPETKEFKVSLLYGDIANTVKSFEDKIITLNVKTYTKNRIVHLNRITKIVIEPAPTIKKETVATAPELPAVEEKTIMLEDTVVIKDEATVKQEPVKKEAPSVGNKITIPDEVMQSIKE